MFLLIWQTHDNANIYTFRNQLSFWMTCLIHIASCNAAVVKMLSTTMKLLRSTVKISSSAFLCNVNPVWTGLVSTFRTKLAVNVQHLQNMSCRLPLKPQFLSFSASAYTEAMWVWRLWSHCMTPLTRAWLVTEVLPHDGVSRPHTLYCMCVNMCVILETAGPLCKSNNSVFSSTMKL